MSNLLGVSKFQVDDEKLACLVGMDFELKTARKALKETKNDLEKAIEKLTS